MLPASRRRRRSCLTGFCRGIRLRLFFPLCFVGVSVHSLSAWLIWLLPTLLEFRPGATGPHRGSLVILYLAAPGAFVFPTVEVDWHPAVGLLFKESSEHLVYLLHKIKTV